MLKNLLFLVFIITLSAQSQTYVRGTLAPANEYNWIVLYQLKDAKTVYISNSSITNGEFKIDFPENIEKGMYRLQYDMKNNGYVDFIYSDKNIALKFNPENPSETIKFLNSEENSMYNTYKRESQELQFKLDSLQMSFLKLINERQQKITSKLYSDTRDFYLKFQKEYEDKTTQAYVNSFIKSTRTYYPEKQPATPQEYLNSKKQHYFDFINFSNNELLNSTLLGEKIINYVFYLNVSDDVEVQNKLYIKAVNELMQKINENTYMKSEVLTMLLTVFSQIENTFLIDTIIENHYNKLPDAYRNVALIDKIQSNVKLAIGKIAPDFSWEENGTIKKLSKLGKADTYILVFWSSTCSHCLKEIPQLYEFTKDKSAIHVVAVALEEDELDFKQQTENYIKWTNILGLEKWENAIAREYEIVSTPSYFVLDSTKKIISKPEFFVDVKDFFKN